MLVVWWFEGLPPGPAVPKMAGETRPRDASDTRQHGRRPPRRT
jgi:hypothetical protein